MVAMGSHAATSFRWKLVSGALPMSTRMKGPPFLLQFSSPKLRLKKTRIYCEVFGSLPLFAGENINCSKILGFSIYGCPYIFEDEDCECDDDDDDDCEDDDEEDEDCEEDDDDDDDCEEDDDDDDCEDEEDDDDDCEEEDDDDDEDCEEDDDDDDDDDDDECECD